MKLKDGQRIDDLRQIGLRKKFGFSLNEKERQCRVLC